MKKILFLLLFLPLLGWCNSWTMAEKDGRFFVQERNDTSLFYSMNYTGKPRILQVISKYAPLEIIEYYAGTTGTSSLIKTTRRIIFNTQEKRFIGDYLFDRELVDQKDLEIEKPKWEIFPDKKEIVIKDLIDGEEQVTVVKY